MKEKPWEKLLSFVCVEEVTKILHHESVKAENKRCSGHFSPTKIHTNFIIVIYNYKCIVCVISYNI